MLGKYRGRRTGREYFGDKEWPYVGPCRPCGCIAVVLMDSSTGVLTVSMAGMGRLKTLESNSKAELG